MIFHKSHSYHHISQFDIFPLQLHLPGLEAFKSNNNQQILYKFNVRNYNFYENLTLLKKQSPFAALKETGIPISHQMYRLRYQLLRISSSDYLFPPPQGQWLETDS